MKKVLIFGTGVAYERIKRIINDEFTEILAYVDNDKNKQGKMFDGKTIISPEDICNYEYDYVVIASSYYEEIKKQLSGLNIDNSKVINYYSIQDNIFDVRIASLKLVADEIKSKNVLGSVAELGVYRGDFAKHINLLFPDRKLYLFDTFEGFAKADTIIENEKNFSDAEVAEFSNTSVELVLSKMQNKENCIIKKGYFPDTAIDVEDNFSFVSLDVDLYKPTYAGLKYFYPRLTHGGYIFIHDYGNVSYSGAKEAIMQFVRENKVGYFPLCDTHLSAIIVK